MDEINNYFNTTLCNEQMGYDITVRNNGLASTNSCDAPHNNHGDLFLERKSKTNRMF